MIKDQITQWWNDNKENPDLVKIREYDGFLYQKQQDAINKWMSIDIASEKLQYLADIKDPNGFTDDKFDDLCTQAKLNAQEKDLLSTVVSLIKENSVTPLDHWSNKVHLTYNLAKYKLGKKIGDISKRSFDYYQNPQANFGCSEENLTYACRLLECSPTDTDLYNYCDSLNLQGVKCKSDVNQHRLYWQILWYSLEIGKHKNNPDYSIWKVSEGWWKDHKKLDSAEELRKQGYVTVADDTPSKGRTSKTQWEYFRDAPKGDICYLCYGNTQIVAIGVFVTDNCEEFDGIWKKRKVEWIFEAVKAGSYQGEKKWWTPSDNSTFIQVPSNEYSLFESWILSPFFNKSLFELIEERNRIMENACCMLNNKQMINDIKNLLENNHNIILHGAPGTGKTYLAKEIAKAMNADYEMVQFHQSYDYTDFVEGLRPAKGNNDKADGFECLPGVFKSFCNKALKNFADSGKKQEELNKELLNDSKLSKFLQEMEGEKLTLKNKSYFEILSYDDEKIRCYAERNEKYPNVILYVKDILKVLNAGIPLSKVDDIVSFFGKKNATQQHSYIFSICEQIRNKYGTPNEGNSAKTNEEDNAENDVAQKKFVFIIDEINRGEMSKIFGELFFSVDPGYRGVSGKVRTQYANMQSRPNDFDDFLGEEEKFGHFFVPENVYIIGTMNDIDRSVESMDFAMRRRFAFKEVTAEDSMVMLDSEDAWKGDDGSGVKPSNSVLGALKAKMTALNEEIAKPEYNLGEAYQIGAAYFLKFGLYFKQSTKEGDEAKAKEAFENLRKYHLESLLREYLRGMDPKGDLLKKLLGAYDENPDQDNANVVQ